MYIYTKKAYEFKVAQDATFKAPAEYMGDAPEGIKNDPLLQMAVADGAVTIVDSKVSAPVKKPQKAKKAMEPEPAEE